MVYQVTSTSLLIASQRTYSPQRSQTERVCRFLGPLVFWTSNWGLSKWPTAPSIGGYFQRVRRQATATPAQGPSRTSDASPLNGLFDLTNLPSRIFERLPSGIIDPGFAPNAFDRFLQGLRNKQQQQQQGQQVPATQVPRLYPDLEGEKLNPGAPAAGGQHGQAGTQVMGHSSRNKIIATKLVTLTAAAPYSRSVLGAPPFSFVV